MVFSVISFISCNKNITNQNDCDSTETLIFQSGFNNCQTSSYNDSKDIITGIDSEFTSNNDWEELNNQENIGDLKISYEDGDKTQRYAELTTDPTDSNNTVIKFKILEPHIVAGEHKKGRVQFNLYENECITEYYQTIKLYLHPDMEYLKEWDEEITWLSVFEFWDNANWTAEDNPFRVTVTLYKPAGKSDYINFLVIGEEQISSDEWNVVWYKIGDLLNVPFGKWMNIELYIKEGDEKTGRFYMAVTPDNEQKIVLFNITNYTHSPDEKNPDGYSHINPLKLYTSDNLINFLSDNNKNLQIYWDDWTFYKNKNPF